MFEFNFGLNYYLFFYRFVCFDFFGDIRVDILEVVILELSFRGREGFS